MKTFELLKDAKIAKESIEIIFEEIMSGSSSSALDALEKASITQLNEDKVNKILDEIILKNSDVIKNDGIKALSLLMGLAMKQLRGKTSGSLVNKLLKESSDFKEMILNPTVMKEDKKKIIFAIADKNNFSQILKNFLGFITIKNRLFFLDKIIKSFINIVSRSKGELKAKVISPKKLSTEEQKKIQKELSKNFKSQLNIDYEYDPSLIAGLIIQIGSTMVDTSIKTKLKKLEKNMLEA